METYQETSCYAGQVDPELELCVGGRMLKPTVGVYRKSEQGFSFVRSYGGEKYDFFGFKVSFPS